MDLTGPRRKPVSAGLLRTPVADQYAHMARRYLHGQARQVATSILAFYCPGLEPERIAQELDGGLLAGGPVAGYAWGATTLLDVLFGAALYRSEGAREEVFESM